MQQQHHHQQPNQIYKTLSCLIRENILNHSQTALKYKKPHPEKEYNTLKHKIYKQSKYSFQKQKRKKENSSEIWVFWEIQRVGKFISH